MAPSILIFDFGVNEALAQQARHKVDGWKQGFRLGNKMQLKFERQEASDGGEQPAVDASENKPSKPSSAAKSGKHPARGESESASRIRVLLRLDFSDHEKLSQQRWLDRIPAEEPFKSAQGETIRAADAGFEKISTLFESLE